MKKSIQASRWYFVDESGDPIFYDAKGDLILTKEGVSPLLIIGFILTTDPITIRQELSNLRQQIVNDPYLSGIPSIQKTKKSFHAKDDCPEVREKVFKLISTLDFSAEIYVARKIENIFKKRHHKNESEFYDDMVSKLFENKLHVVTDNKIYFAVRGNRARQAPLEKAILVSKENFEMKKNTKITTQISVQAQTPEGEPCLQIIDYVNWAIQRTFLRKEARFLSVIESKIKYLVDIYDTAKYPNNYYNKGNKFDINKISPL
ncbi:MAG: hypothetical protein ACD_40C00213G0040 [uncultured bacterium]|nr:MAG: hypothetical protein ACD_40C00213G0040 [uncultured bacterium]KKU14811.1 MAG: hypothetical protein UX21_C0010G0019 [Microgenomates group bacterium GW2011_GWC2_45_8]KKU26252.1 MAG: hypothetical protein UX37_C0004G0047 [Microgenomates group bacterium GW2011_GWA2_46_16]